MKATIYTVPEYQPPIIAGKGASKVLFLLNKDDVERNVDTLKGLVAAIKLDYENDIYLIEKETSFPIAGLAIEFEKAVVFGIPPAELSLNINASQNFLHKLEKYHVIFTHSLSDLNSDRNKKMALWKTLQTTFL